MTIHREGKLDSRMYLTKSFCQSKSKSVKSVTESLVNII